jgi:hypothetical protein
LYLQVSVQRPASVVLHALRPPASFTQNSGAQSAFVVHAGRHNLGPISLFGAQRNPVQQSVSASHVSSTLRHCLLQEVLSRAQTPRPLVNVTQQPDGQSPFVTQYSEHVEEVSPKNVTQAARPAPPEQQSEFAVHGLPATAHTGGVQVDVVDTPTSLGSTQP